jgi:hypothetical protein
LAIILFIAYQIPNGVTLEVRTGEGITCTDEAILEGGHHYYDARQSISDPDSYSSHKLSFDFYHNGAAEGNDHKDSFVSQ